MRDMIPYFVKKLFKLYSLRKYSIVIFNDNIFRKQANCGGFAMTLLEKRQIYKVEAGKGILCEDTLLREFSLCVSYQGRTQTLFCTEQDLPELAAGYLYSTYGTDIRECEVRWQNASKDGAESGASARVEVTESEGIHKNTGSTAQTLAVQFSIETIAEEVERFGNRSDLFARTGNMHSAGWIGMDGGRLFAEDIGRHNALDKLIGKALYQNVNLAEGMILLSGRVPSDMMKKLMAAGAVMAASVSAPTLDSVQLAQEQRITLIGFARRGRMNIYTDFGRIGGGCYVFPEGIAQK